MRKIVFSLVAAAATASCAAKTIHTAAELAAVGRGEPTDATNFVLSVTLLREWLKDPTNSVFVCDKSGATSLLLPLALRKTIQNPGDQIRVAGKIETNKHGSAIILAQSWEVAGKGKPSSAIPTHIRDIHAGSVDFQVVRLTATVHDVYTDDIDKDFNFLVLIEDGQTVYAAIPASFLPPQELQALVGATTTITGVCDAYRSNTRHYRGRMLCPTTKDDIVIDRPAFSDSYTAPDISTLDRAPPHQLHMFGRCTAHGRVIAAWNKSSVLIETGDEEYVGIDITGGLLPAIGDEIVACGFPETDLYTITLTRATWKPTDDNQKQTKDTQSKEPPPVRTSDLIEKDSGREIMQPHYHGKPIRIEGLVRTLPSAGNESRLFIDCLGTIFPVDISAKPAVANTLEIGCRAAFTGICVMNVERLRPNTVFPRIRGFTLVMRPTDYVVILSRPTWWTPGRVWSTFGGLVGLLLAVFCWNTSLRRLADRRSRELTNERLSAFSSSLKVEERTRLAVELHDTIAQTLTGVSLEIDAARDFSRTNAEEMERHLDCASRTLTSCRNELRNCMWDLRNQTLDDISMDEAIRRTLTPHLSGASLAVRFAVNRDLLSDNTALSILRIIRELTLNAIRHGKATTIRIAGCIEGNRLLFSVKDNGCGFDPSSIPGVEQGHFGLQGVTERIETLGGTLTIDSEPGTGTRASISITLPSVQFHSA